MISKVIYECLFVMDIRDTDANFSVSKYLDCKSACPTATPAALTTDHANKWDKSTGQTKITNFPSPSPFQVFPPSGKARLTV